MAGSERIDFEGFTVWVDCDKRGAVKLQYNAQVTLNVLNRFTLAAVFLHHANSFQLKHTNKKIGVMIVVIWFRLLLF
jgi:hypothetical protein